MSVDVTSLVTENLDIWSSTIKAKSATGRGSKSKHELYGVKKIRELILELAVRGLLVPQDSSDEPASVLLEKIAAEKARLVKDKLFQKTSKLKPKKNLDWLPENWTAVQTGEVCPSIVPNRDKPKKFSGHIPWVTLPSFPKKGLYLDEAKVELGLTDEEVEEYSARLIPERSVLMSCVGRFGMVAINRIPVTSNQQIHAYIMIGGVEPEYLCYVIKASANILHSISTSTTVSYLNKTNCESIDFGLPPFAEQKRIVIKVSELMALCDQLEQQQESSISAHQTLVETLLGSLTNAADNKAFQQAWQRIAENFDVLFTTENSIDQLKQTILQLAVMGKLVPQDPSDEPTSVLLGKIAEEKAQLIKDKKIKKQKPLPPISDEEMPYELPQGWEWSRISSISNVGTGATPSRTNFSYFNPPEVNWVTSGETSEEFVGETKEKVSWSAVEETNVSVYPSGTLIVAMYGQGKTRGQITELLQPAGTNQACAAIQLIEPDAQHRKYIKLFFVKAYDEIRKLSAGGAQPNLNVGKVSLTVIPIPPIREQHRIVTKVNELMTLCNNMIDRIRDAQIAQLNLTDTIAEQAVG